LRHEIQQLSSEKKSFPSKQSKMKLKNDQLNNLKEQQKDKDNMNMDEIDNDISNDFSD